VSADACCDTCYFAWVTDVGLECRRLPPYLGAGRIGIWPLVADDDICGEYEQQIEIPWGNKEDPDPEWDPLDEIDWNDHQRLKGRGQ
jgi:hypothetical protein